MEIAGSNDSASSQPNGVQGIADQHEHEFTERALRYIHVARAALAAAEADLGNREPDRRDAHRIAAAISIAVAESACFDAAEALAQYGGVKAHGGRRSALNK